MKSDIGVVLLFPMQSLEEFRSFWLARLEGAPNAARYRSAQAASQVCGLIGSNTSVAPSRPFDHEGAGGTETVPSRFPHYIGGN